MRNLFGHLIAGVGRPADKFRVTLFSRKTELIVNTFAVATIGKSY